MRTVWCIAGSTGNSTLLLELKSFPPVCIGLMMHFSLVTCKDVFHVSPGLQASTSPPLCSILAERNVL